MTPSRLGKGQPLPVSAGRAAGVRAVAASIAWPTVAAVAGLATLLVYLALTPLPPFAADVYGSLVRRYTVLGALMLGYLLWLLLRRRLPRRSAFDLPLAAMTLAVLLAVAGSADRRVSLEHVLPLLPSLVLFYILLDSAALDARPLAWAVVLAAGVVAVFALASVWRSVADWWSLMRAVEGGLTWSTLLPPRTPRVADVGNHPNVLGTVFAMALPAALSLWGGAHRTARTALASAVLLIAVALFFTLSRAAWLGAFAGLAVWAAARVTRARTRLRVPRRLWFVLALGAVLAAMAAIWLLLGDARPEWLFRDSLGPRSDMRRVGWAIFRDNPFTGAGPGLFVALYPIYGGAFPFAAVHAHTIVVQTAADTGILGLLAGGFLLVVVLVTLGRGLRGGDIEARRAVAVAAGMLAALLVHALADSPQLFPEVQALGVVALVMLARVVEPTPARAPRDQRLRSLLAWPRRLPTYAGWAGPGAAVLLAAALPVAWLLTSRAHQAYNESVGRARDQRWPEAVTAAERAVDRDDRFAAAWFQLGTSHASAAIDGDRRAEQQAALAAFRRGLELEPHNGAALVDYAALNVALGRPEVARAALPAIARLAGRDSLLLLAHATITQWVAPPEQAIEAYAGLLAINPTLAGTPLWRDNGFRQAHFDRIVDRAIARAPEVAGSGPQAAALRAAISLYAGRGAPAPDALEAALSDRPEDVELRVALGRLLMTAAETRPRALDLLRGAVQRKGDDPSARAALGDLYALDGDRDRARREWAAAAYLGDLAAAVSLGQSFPPGEVPGPVRARAERLLEAAEIGRFYLIFQSFRFTFQREEPLPIILPGDWLLALPSELPSWRAAVESWR